MPTTAPYDVEPLAKSADFNDGVVETLEQHTENLVKILSGLMRRSPQLPALVGEPNLWHLAFWICVLHDFGKAATGFQARLRGGSIKYSHRHEVLSLAFLPWAATASEIRLMTLGIVSHHKDAELIGTLYREYYRESNGAELLKEFDSSMIAWLADWLERVPNTWIEKYDLAQFGVQRKVFTINLETFQETATRSLEDGIKLYENINPLDTPYPDEPEYPAFKLEQRLLIVLRGLITQSDRMASAHAPIPEVLKLPTLETLTTQLAARLQRPVKARVHQLAAQRPGNIIFNAPTGSGKTEAALGWAAVQQADVPRRLIYALPYQASLNAMQKRLTDDLKPVDGVAILHSRALQVMYRQALEIGNDDANPQEITKQVRRQRDFNKLHQPAVAVLTLYQMLRAMYRVPGYEGILTMLIGSSLVLDEIHAYEPTRLGMFLALIKTLIADYDVRVCAMTATMPSWLRTELELCLEVTAIKTDPAIFVQSRRHKLELKDAMLEDASTIESIVQQVKAGFSVLVAVNTVKKAQAIWQTLKDRLGAEQTLLLHSRFTGHDRLEKEQELQQKLDANTGSSQAIAVVATQVIEVSLDLDFDRIITEPAPLEALVQRFGRVNRRGTKGDNGIVPVTVLTQPRDGQGVYDNRLIEGGLVQLENAVLTGQTELDDLLISTWLDAVYTEDVLKEFRDVVRAQAKEFTANTINEMKPFASDRELGKAFDKLFDGIQVLPKKFEATYIALLETSPIQARGYMVNAPNWITGGLRELVQWSETLKLFVADLPYSKEIGMEFKRPEKKHDIYGEMDD